MNTITLENKLDSLISAAVALGYKTNKPTLFIDKCYGNKLGYYQHNTNKIVIDEHYAEHANDNEIIGTLIHEVAHAVAEQNNDTGKRI